MVSSLDLPRISPNEGFAKTMEVMPTMLVTLRTLCVLQGCTDKASAVLLPWLERNCEWAVVPFIHDKASLLDLLSHALRARQWWCMDMLLQLVGRIGHRA